MLVATVAFLDLSYLQLLSTTFGGRQSYFRGFRLSSGFEDIRLVSVRLIHRLRLSTNILLFLTTVANPPSLPIPPPRNWKPNYIILYYNDIIIFVFIHILFVLWGCRPLLVRM